MKKKNQKDKLQKMNIAALSINKAEDEKKDNKKSPKKLETKSKSSNKIFKMAEESKPSKQNEIKEEEKSITYNLDFVFRRERYILKGLHSNYLLSRVKKLISKKISVDFNLIHVYYLEKELTNDKINVYDLIKDNKIKYFEIKKESPNNENIMSLNPNINLIYKVKCKNIQNAKDFIDKIDIFFRDKCLEKHYLCEPVDKNVYDVGFCCEDNCYQFKRYMSIVKRLDSNYSNTTFEYVPIPKHKIIKPKLENLPTISYKSSESEKPKIRRNPNINKTIESIYINKGPYMTFEDIQKLNEKEERKKWINKKGFVYKKA
jgi:hypothetical protein